jgi:hypothetical protein
MKKRNLLCANKNFDNNINFKIIYGDVFEEEADVIGLSLDNINGFKNPYLQRIANKKKRLLEKINELQDNSKYVLFRNKKYGFVDYRTGTIHFQKRFLVCNFPKNLEEYDLETCKILIEKLIKNLFDNNDYFSITLIPLNNFEFSFRLEKIAEIMIEFISQYEFPREIKKQYKKKQNKKQKQMEFLGNENSEHESFDDESEDSNEMISGDDSSFLESDIMLADVILKKIRIVCPYKAQVIKANF